MKVISTNIAKPRTIEWDGEHVLTGIYKLPTDQPIHLELENVKDDEVSDREVHGGIYKACYLFSTDVYPYWKNLYPDLNWNWGMFGENLSMEGLDETQICIGDTYKLGTAIVQVTQPREPCFKLGVKFENMKILKQFVKHGRSGIYVRILKEGRVTKGDSMMLIERPEEQITIAQFLELLYDKEKDQKLLKIALQNDALSIKKRIELGNFVTY